MGSELSSRLNQFIGTPNIIRRDAREIPSNEYNSDDSSSDISVSEEPLNYEMEKFTRKWFKEQPIMEFAFDCGDNGAVIEDKLIPEEVLSSILSYLDCESLLHSRLVCQRWKNLIDLDIWRFKLEKKIYRNLINLLNDVPVPFPVFYKVWKQKPFNRNLIRNSSGEDSFRHWRRIESGGDGWRIEKPPAGSDVLPFDENFSTTCCFATSYNLCSKMQVIDLLAKGLTPIIMDDLQPNIYISELYAARFDCACTYTISVTLLDKSKSEIDSFTETRKIDQWQGREWHKVEHEFKNYGKGVRFIKFFHSGMDCQFWKGFYGSKMSRACVKVVL